MFQNLKNGIRSANGSFHSYDFVEQELRDNLHSHEYWECVFVYAGRVRAQLGARNVDFDPGMIVLIPPKLLHSWTTQGAYTVSAVALQFGDDALPPALLHTVEMAQVSNRLKDRGCVSILRTNDVERQRARMRSVHRSRGALKLARLLVAMDLVCQQKLLESFNQEEDGKMKPHAFSRFQRAKEMIERRYESRLTRAEVAAEVGLEENAFSRFFHEASGMKFSDFLANRRISRAAILLGSRRDMNVKELARRCGFSNVSAFNRQFLKRLGTTPSAYRKSADSEPILP